MTDEPTTTADDDEQEASEPKKKRAAVTIKGAQVAGQPRHPEQPGVPPPENQ